MQDGAQEPRREIFAAMDRHDRRTPVRMPHVEVAAFLSDALKPKTFKDANKLGRLKDRKFAHEGTLTC